MCQHIAACAVGVQTEPACHVKQQGQPSASHSILSLTKVLIVSLANRKLHCQVDKRWCEHVDSRLQAKVLVGLPSNTQLVVH